MSDMTSISKVGVTVDSKDDFDLMGDIFYVSVPIVISISQPPERCSSYSLLMMHLLNILLWCGSVADPTTLSWKQHCLTLMLTNGLASRARKLYFPGVGLSPKGGLISPYPT